MSLKSLKFKSPFFVVVLLVAAWYMLKFQVWILLRLDYLLPADVLCYSLCSDLILIQEVLILVRN